MGSCMQQIYNSPNPTPTATASRPAATLRLRLVAGCCSRWQLGAQEAATAPVCSSCHVSWHPMHQHIEAWISVGTGKCMQQHVNSQQPGCKTALSSAAVSVLLQPLAVGCTRAATAPVCSPCHVSWHHCSSDIRAIYMGTGKCMQQHVNS